MRRHRIWSSSWVLPVALVGALAVWSCSGDTGTQPSPNPDLPQANELFVVTEPSTLGISPMMSSLIGAAGEGASYVSLAPGLVPEGDSVEARNVTTGTIVAAPMIEGGFDPIPVPASVGDELEITVFSSGTVIMRMMVSVPAERPPRVVRTDPRRGRTRVPLNSIIVITPTEPLDPVTVTAQTVRLMQNGVPVPVAATVSLSSDGLRVELVPKQQLQPRTAYVISVSTAVRDVAGDPFTSEYTSDFTTIDPTAAVGTIVFQSVGYTPRVYKMNADGTGVVELAEYFNGWMSLPTLSPDGQLIAFANAGWLIVMHVDGTGMRTLVQAGDYATRPAWSPDGSRIAFAGTRDDPANRDIYVVNIDGTGVLRLTTDPATDERPSWSPDGNRIVLHSYRGGNWDLYIMNADGSNTTRLTTHPANDMVPSWSPDGGRIAFQSFRDGNTEIYLIDADGTNLVRVTDDSVSDGSPAWSPDGTRIVFVSGRQGGRGLHTMNPDGTGLVRLTAGGHYYPSWGP